MKLVNRYETCVGLTLFKSTRYHIEIWFIPKHYKIIEHTHPNEEIELTFLFGSSTFYRKNLNTLEVDTAPVKSIKDTFKTFTVLPIHSHWFKSNSRGLIFINKARFINGHKPVSASLDFKPYV